MKRPYYLVGGIVVILMLLAASLWGAPFNDTIHPKACSLRGGEVINTLGPTPTEEQARDLGYVSGILEELKCPCHCYAFTSESARTTYEQRREDILGTTP